jgi:hypothetical protein
MLLVTARAAFFSVRLQELITKGRRSGLLATVCHWRVVCVDARSVLHVVAGNRRIAAANIYQFATRAWASSTVFSDPANTVAFPFSQ